MGWTPRTIKDQSVEFPYRYALKDISTGQTIATYDIVSEPGEIYQAGTEKNAAYFQPIEDFLKLISDDLAAFGLEIIDINSKASDSYTRLESIETKIPFLAPLANPVLTNPTANTPTQTDNSTRLATTAFTRTYLDNLMAAFKG